MDNQFYRPSNNNGFQYSTNVSRNQMNIKQDSQTSNKRDEDLIIEDNTIYEIDRECYERTRKQKKRR